MAITLPGQAGEDSAPFMLKPVDFTADMATEGSKFVFGYIRLFTNAEVFAKLLTTTGSHWPGAWQLMQMLFWTIDSYLPINGIYTSSRTSPAKQKTD
ncbi:MAG: hypothetical protein AAF065_05055 [Verrucomicrobiota bacterium]